MSEVLIASLKNDDPLAMNHIFSVHWETIFDAAFRKVGDEDIAQDITQEIFISLWENRQTLDVEGSLSGYLYGAVKFKVINYYRSKATKENHHAEFSALLAQQQFTNTADQNLNLQDASREIEAALQRLPERMRLVIFMSRKEDKSIKEIAEELNVSAQTVKNQITAAMKILREDLSYTLLIAFFLY